MKPRGTENEFLTVYDVRKLFNTYILRRRKLFKLKIICQYDFKLKKIVRKSVFAVDQFWTKRPIGLKLIDFYKLRIIITTISNCVMIFISFMSNVSFILNIFL